jgi:hypothetical protein
MQNGELNALLAPGACEGSDRIRSRGRELRGRERGPMCAQALVGIEYEARVELVDAAPGTIVVEHDGSPVTTEKR